MARKTRNKIKIKMQSKEYRNKTRKIKKLSKIISQEKQETKKKDQNVK